MQLYRAICLIVIAVVLLGLFAFFFIRGLYIGSGYSSMQQFIDDVRAWPPFKSLVFVHCMGIIEGAIGILLLQAFDN